MIIVYRDELGYVECKVDCGVTFFNGFALFESGGKHYKIPLENLFEIIEDEK